MDLIQLSAQQANRIAALIFSDIAQYVAEHLTEFEEFCKQEKNNERI